MTQLLNIMLFQIVPTVLEFTLVLSLLAWKLGPTIAGAILSDILAESQKVSWVNLVMFRDYISHYGSLFDFYNSSDSKTHIVS